MMKCKNDRERMLCDISMVSFAVVDLTLYLDVPTDFTEQLLRHREQDTHTSADIHERNSAYLASCRRAGRAAAEYYGWTIISCTENGKMRSIEDIHEEIYRHAAACLED